MDMAEKDTQTDIVSVDVAPLGRSSPEIDMQIATAKQYPRSIQKVKSEALTMATVDDATAASMSYALPRGGKNITGPSVRLAEIFAIAWGNLRAETRIGEAQGDFIAAEAVCWDLEKNVAIKAETRRRIVDKYGKRYKPDMIMTTGNAAASIALRNAIFHIIPRAYVDSVAAQAERVALGDAKNMTVVRQQHFALFHRFGVTDEQILLRMGRESIEDITVSDIKILRGYFTAIKEEGEDVTTIFPPVEPEGAKEKKGALRSKLDAARGKDAPAAKKTEPKEPPKPEPEPETAPEPEDDNPFRPHEEEEQVSLQAEVPADEIPEDDIGKLRVRYMDMCEAHNVKTGPISAMSADMLKEKIAEMKQGE
jgi:hypothetical protein